MANDRKRSSGRKTQATRPKRSKTTSRSGSPRARSGEAKAERRAQILAAARDVFARRGYHEATVDDIVAAAGVARGTFYLYFEDKRAVFVELTDRFWARLTMAINAIVTDDPRRPVEQQVRENIRGVMAACLSDRTMTKILLAGTTGIDPAFDRKLSSFYDEVIQLLTQSLHEGQSLGIVRDGEPRVLAYLSIGALKELLIQAVTLGLSDESTDAFTDQVFVFLSEGYLRLQQSSPRRSRSAARVP